MIGWQHPGGHILEMQTAKCRYVKYIGGRGYKEQGGPRLSQPWAQGQEAMGIVPADVRGLVLSPSPHLGA